jgi:hypothetical protein
MKSFALLTSNPRLIRPFLEDPRLGATGLKIPLVFWMRPSMAFADRARGLRATLVRQARMNGTSLPLQFCHHTAYRLLGRGPGSDGLEEAATLLERGREVHVVRSYNEPRVALELAGGRVDAALVMGGDVLRRATIAAAGVPIYNVHYGDPSFVRGMPPFFWEILAGRDEIAPTLHQVVPRLDAGPIVAQRRIPTCWRPGLARTLKATRDAADAVVTEMLMETLPHLLEGRVRPMAATPGPLRTTPSTLETLRAERICRRRARSRRLTERT